MKNTFGLITYILKRYPFESLVTVLLLLLSGVLEGMSITLIVPLMSTLTKESESVSFLEAVTGKVLGAVGITPELGPMLVLLVAVVSVAALVKFISGVQIGLVTTRIAKNLRFALIEAIFRARWGYSSQMSPGRVNAALGIETESAASIYTITGKMIASAWQAVVGLVIAGAISISVTIGGLGFGILTALLFATFITRTRIVAQIRKDAMEVLSTRIVEFISSLKAIKAMGDEDRFLAMLASRTETIRNACARLAIYERAVNVLPEPVAALALAIMLYAYVGMFSGSLETAMALAVLFSRSATAIRTMQRAYQSLVRQEPSHLFVLKMIAGAEAAAEQFDGRRKPQFRQSITLRDLTVVYDGASRPALERVSLRLPSTGLVTIAGPSGAGKSTLVNAIAGIESPTAGALLIDNAPLYEFDMAQWRQTIGYVPQETFLFPDSVRENVSLMAVNITEQAIVTALREAEAWKFVEALPRGIETELGQAGSKLSGGERQRISLARALVRKPRLLILDEPTAALDDATELEVCHTLQNISAHILVLVISHKQALADAANIIVQLADGKLVDTVQRQTGTDSNAPDNIALAGAGEVS